MLTTLVVLGAGGDLTGRLLLPAVAALRAAGALGDGFRFVGAGDQAWTADGFRAHARGRLSAHAPFLAADALDDVLDYRRADVTDAAAVAGVLDVAGPGPLVVYLALPTRLMPDAVAALNGYGLPAGSRVAVEKPFGQDGAGAVHLNAALDGLDAYRVDHVLAMTAIRDLADGWRPGLERVELLFDETLGLEGRASFYDRAGALRDVMQNHLVQVLCTLVAPASGGADERAAVLRTVRPVDVGGRTRRGRYTAGVLADGRRVPDYVAEDGVDPARGTETFAEVIVELDDARWTGVPLVLRAGKALDVRRRGVVLHPREGDPVVVDLDAPDGGGPAGAEPAAYQRILLDLLSGGSTYAVGATEAELAWDVFTPVLAAWAAGDVPMLTYPAGSSGP